MGTTQTYLQRSGMGAACLDELDKIAAAQKKPQFKRWLKNSLILAAGYGAGHGAGMLAEHGLKKLLGKKQIIRSKTGRIALYGATGLAGLGTMLARQRMMDEKRKADRG